MSLICLGVSGSDFCHIRELKLIPFLSKLLALLHLKFFTKEEIHLIQSTFTWDSGVIFYFTGAVCVFTCIRIGQDVICFSLSFSEERNDIPKKKIKIEAKLPTVFHQAQQSSGNFSRMHMIVIFYANETSSC